MNRIDWLAKICIDDIFSENPEVVWGPAAAMLGLAALAFVARVASRWFIFNAGRDAEYELRAILLDRLHKLGTAFYRKMSSGEIMSRSTGDLLQVRLLLGFGVLNMINVVFAFASALQIMVTISGRLTLASFVMLPFLILTTRSFSKGLFTRTKANQDAMGKLSDVLQTNLAGIRVVRSFALEARERERFRAANDAYLEASLGLARLRGLMGPMVGAASSVGLLACFFYGGLLLSRGPQGGGLSQGDFFAFWMALGRMTWPMVALGFSLAIVQRGRAGYARLQEIFDAKPEIEDGAKAAPAALAGELDVSHLSFMHGTKRVLDDVSFHLEAGKSLAIMGRTGSGKSTLAMLLARLLPTPAGTVAVDGNDICDLPLAEVRGAIGYAQQDAFLFSSTVTRNVGFSLEAPEDDEGFERVRAAAREAQVLEEALSLPEGFDTVVGERGVQLSGGQKQRIALARALVREPVILVLDDPLSAVDAKTEAAILEAIDRQAAHRTVVLVTNRVAAAKRCGSILVLDAGRVVERGSHDELVKIDGGIYASFDEEQSATSELDAIDVDAPRAAEGR
ncbi:MAG: ABC transporter ATP-binding protein [Myxococcales bacterium]|nr:ABC transporter ATP-binding protein [Myxococcales bacterium]